MTTNLEIDQCIEELCHTVTVAALNYDIWWVYKSEDTRPDYVTTMQRYNLFFQTSLHAHFVALLIALYRLYETRKDTYNIPSLLRKLRKQNLLISSTLSPIEDIYKKEAKPRWLKVHKLRNEAFGHRSNTHTVEQVFQEAGITPSDLKELIAVTKRLLNELMQAWSEKTHAFNLEARRHTLMLLSDLEKLRNS